MRVKKVVFRVVGMVMIMSLFAGCGKNNNDSDNNKQTVESATYQEDNTTTQVSESKREDSELLTEQEVLFSDFFTKIPKGYIKYPGVEMVLNQNTGDKYISWVLIDNKKILSDITAEQIEEEISTLMYIDDGIAKNVRAYTKNAVTKIDSISDVEVNGSKMKKFEGKMTVAKSSFELDTKWDCYIYGYAFESERATMIFYGFEQEQSQPADEIAKMKKNMDAMIKTIRLV